MVKQLYIALLLSFSSIYSQTPSPELDSLNDSSQISPEFEFVTLAGEKVSSGSLKGKIIVLDFWSSGCIPCRKAMQQMEKFYNQYKNDPRVVIYLVNSGWETIEKAKNFADSKRSTFLIVSYGSKYNLPFAYDNGSTTMKAFGFDSNPSTIIIDSKFRIRVKHSEAIENIYDYLTGHVDLYLNEKRQ
jgi:cytochrome c biogenesis protein CcmG, thiol:disulfide interchange protein DsbE